MHIPEEFIPDFSCKSSTGVICNRYSKIQCIDRYCYISLYNKINIWNFNSAELLYSVGNRNHRITSFLVDKNSLFLGYEDGCVEIFEDISFDESANNIQSKIVKIHSKSVSKIILHNDTIITASKDGTLSSYDLVLEEPIRYYSGNSASIESIIMLGNEKICAVCSDKCLKIWDISSDALYDAIAFESYLFDAVCKGSEILAFLSSGESYFVDIDSKSRRPFEKFKNIRNICFKNSVLGVQSQKKCAIFKSTKESSLGLVNSRRFESSPLFVNFDLVGDEPCFLSQSNIVICGEKKIDFGFHQDDIIGVKTDRSKIYTLSKERFVCWDRNNTTEQNDVEDENTETLSLNTFVKIKNATCFGLFANQIVVGTNEGILIFDKKTFEQKNEIKTDKISSIGVSEHILAVCVGDQVLFYDTTMKKVKELTAPESIVYSRFTDDASSLFLSCLDNKIYQYLIPSLELKVTLYGHSLPVRQFSISTDQKLLASCGADKLVKIWGLDFGECRKTIVGDSNSVEFFNDRLFAFSDKNIEYYNYFDHLKKFKTFVAGILCPGTDYFVASSGRGISLYSMKKYEFISEENSEELITSANKAPSNIKEYDTFLDHLERLEVDFTEGSIKQFYEFVERLDFNDLKEYLYVLDHVSIRLILKVILATVDMNPHVNSRIFVHLAKNHRDVCIESGIFPEIQSKLFEKIRYTRDLFNRNLARLDIDIEEITEDFLNLK